MALTKIEWADLTFNPWWGCERVSPGCAHCYAATLATRYGHGDTWGAGHGFRFFGEKHWAEPLKWARTLPAKLGRRPRVFCASMADVFEERPELEEHRRRLFNLILQTPELDWLILTKRPEFAQQWICVDSGFGFSEHNNLWMGVSIENSRFTWRADVLREIPAVVRFISAEPLLGSLFKSAPAALVPHSEGLPREAGASAADGWGRQPLDLSDIDWLIVGGESGPGARPCHLEHVREVVRACDAESRERSVIGEMPIATFVKQLGAKPVFESPSGAAHLPPAVEALPLRDRKGGDWSEWPSDLRIREFPRRAAA